MSGARSLAAAALAVAALAGWAAGGPGVLAPGAAGPAATAAGAQGSLRFADEVGAGERRVVHEAIAAARPEARALIDRVDGAVTVRVGPTGREAVGLTSGSREGGYTVTLDLAQVSAHLGPRGVRRLVLHELGHVVDHALLAPAQQRALDAGIPRGYACRPGEHTGACATREERFAETFAKWAAGDIGINVSLGYKVPPPPSLDAWGAGLTADG